MTPRYGPPLAVGASLFALAGAIAGSSWALGVALLLTILAGVNEAIRMERLRDVVDSIDDVLAQVLAHLEQQDSEEP